MKIITGDKVKIILGKDKGRTGPVLKVFTKQQRLVVKGLNLFKKHVKAQQGQSGGIIEKERPLQISKVMLVCPSCQKPTRVGYKIDQSQKKHRVCKKCQALITKPVKK